MAGNHIMALRNVGGFQTKEKPEQTLTQEEKHLLRMQKLLFKFSSSGTKERHILLRNAVSNRRLCEARLIKTSRQILGFNLKTRKAKQPATGSHLNLHPKIVILLPGNLRIKLRLRAASSCFITLSRSGIKGVHH